MPGYEQVKKLKGIRWTKLAKFKSGKCLCSLNVQSNVLSAAMSLCAQAMKHIMPKHAYIYVHRTLAVLQNKYSLEVLAMCLSSGYHGNCGYPLMVNRRGLSFSVVGFHFVSNHTGGALLVAELPALACARYARERRTKRGPPYC